MISNEVTITYIVHFNKTTESGSPPPPPTASHSRAADSTNHARNTADMHACSVATTTQPRAVVNALNRQWAADLAWNLTNRSGSSGMKAHSDQ